jgi:ABC-type multidrug transport system fused ATPase/permease subunit
MFSNFFDRLSTGWTAGKACLEVLKANKKLVAFPLLSGICCLIVLASFAVPLAVIKPKFIQAAMDGNGDVHQTPIWFWVGLFVFYFANYFVIYFFNSALVYCALAHFQGQPSSADDGLRAAAQRLPEILVWSLVSASVGLILRLIENANEKFGEIASAILGGAWSVATYFVVPVLVVEGVGPMKAIQRSWTVLTRTWGESIGGHAGIGWALLPFWLIGLVMIALGAFVATKSIALGVILLAVAVIYMFILGLVDATLKGILLGALYLYATAGEVPDEFGNGLMKRMFTTKNKNNYDQ